MDIEEQIKQLQTMYSGAQSAATNANAQYHALLAAKANTSAISMAKARWLQLELRKTEIIKRMVALEELEMDAAVH